MEQTQTFRDPPNTFLQLQLRDGESTLIADHATDHLTFKVHITNALSQYLGITGTAIPVDVLKVCHRRAWVRVPRDDETAVVAALSQWSSRDNVSLQILARSTWLGNLDDQIVDAKLWSLDA